MVGVQPWGDGISLLFVPQFQAESTCRMTLLQKGMPDENEAGRGAGLESG